MTQSYHAHILVVDDNEDIRAFLSRSILEPEGYQVTVAANGEQGLRLALEQQPDLMLLDYEMPRMNGIEVLRALKEHDIRLPTILITSYGSESVAVEVFRLGVRDYVPKPFTIAEILEAIEHALYEVLLERERDALFAKLQQTNAQLAQRIKELDILYHVSKSVTTLQEREKLLERVVDAALYLTGALDGRLVLLDPQTGDIITQVLRERRDAGQAATGTLRALETQTTGLLMHVPLQVGQSVVGALTVSNKRNRQPLNQQDKRLLRMLADYAAIAIENFRLLAEIEAQRAREKRDLRERLAHYIAPPLVERVLHQPHSVHPGGERHRLTVLFADLRDFTAFSQRASPEALMAVLNRHIAVATDVVLKARGTVDKFVGDEVMALFNVPFPQDEYALQAVVAAWRIQHTVQQIHPTLPVQQRFLFGIGIATGQAVVGNVGTERFVNYTAVGPLVGKAHRLQAHTTAGGILICHNTYEMVQHYIHTKPLTPIGIKGQQHPEPVYEVRAVLMDKVPEHLKEMYIL